jgi:hypothetical protein
MRCLIYVNIYIERGYYCKYTHIDGLMDSYRTTGFKHKQMSSENISNNIFQWLWDRTHNQRMKKNGNTIQRTGSILSNVDYIRPHMKPLYMSSKPTEQKETHITHETLHKPAPTSVTLPLTKNVLVTSRRLERSYENRHDIDPMSDIYTTKNDNQPIIAQRHHVTWKCNVLVHCIPSVTRTTRNERRAYLDKLTVGFDSVVEVREIPLCDV